MIFRPLVPALASLGIVPAAGMAAPATLSVDASAPGKAVNPGLTDARLSRGPRNHRISVTSDFVHEAPAHALTLLRIPARR